VWWSVADKPSAPRDLRVTGTADGSVDLSWSPPTDDGGSELTEYVVEKREALRMSWQPAATLPARSTAAAVAGLDPSGTVTYLFRVSAVNAVGSGPPDELTRAVAARAPHSQSPFIITSTHTHARTHARTHTHTHTFGGPLSGTTWVSRYKKGKPIWISRDSEWQWHQLGRMQVCTSLQTDNHTNTPPLSFLQAGCPSCRPTNSVKALKAILAITLLAISVLDGTLGLGSGPPDELTRLRTVSRRLLLLAITHVALISL